MRAASFRLISYWRALNLGLLLALCLGLSGLVRADDPANGDGINTPDYAPAEASADAGPPPVRARIAEPAQREIKAVLNGPDFGKSETTWDLRLRNLDRSKPTHREPPAWLQWLARMVGYVFGHFLWFLLAVLIVLVIWQWRRWAALFGLVTVPTLPTIRQARQERHTVSSTEAALPLDIAAEAQACWEAGDARGALSLLYRGALTVLRQRSQLDLPASATERENLARVRATQPIALVEDFGRIVRAWQAVAYANRHPADFDGLMQSFRRQFGSGGET